MKSFKGYLLAEATTTAATKTEMAICFHWNKAVNKGISDEKALELAQISVGNWSKVNLEKEGKVGENVVKNLLKLNLKGNAIHYGSGNNPVSDFWSNYGAGKAASSRTPKTDLIIGGKTISLKMGAGQLMSGKTPESTATFYAALMEAGEDLKRNPKVVECIEVINSFSEGYINDTITNLKKNDWKDAPQEIKDIEAVHKKTMEILGSLFKQDKNFQRAFIKEAMTGHIKFGKGSNASADYFLVGSKDGSSISFHDINKGDYVDKVVSKTKISVKHKTTSEAKTIGGKKVKTGRRKWWSALGLSTADMTKDLISKAPKNESYNELHEGFLKDVWNKAKSTVAGFMGKVKQVLKGTFKSVLGFLGFEPEVEYKIVFPK